MNNNLALLTFATLVLFNYASCVALENASDCVDNFCAVVDNYPELAIDNIIKGSEKYKEIFNSVDVSLPNEIARKTSFNKTTDESLCESHQRLTFPRRALNSNSQLRMIVNTSEFKQALVLEVCGANTQCKFSDQFPNQVRSGCKQKYFQRRLLSMDVNGQTIYMDVYDVPSCCVCTIQKF